ncbi:hypothetical protein A2U01_0108123 [Trifolium medium]|uniref:Uncharacterized protein n=1 Tax=Trifolium medium TaxID=97028 RepID=A0A392VHF1_9FABA|nr:hypothetical protein [Trifolium medium]
MEDVRHSSSFDGLPVA